VESRSWRRYSPTLVTVDGTREDPRKIRFSHPSPALRANLTPENLRALSRRADVQMEAIFFFFIVMIKS